MAMERLSQDLNLALEESNCNKHGRKKFGLRRRTRSTGNIHANCINGVTEDGSSSSPLQQQAAIAQTSNPNELQTSDSDDPQLNTLQNVGAKTRALDLLESDSFNENFSPTKPPNARRKRKFKKMTIDCPDNNDKIATSLINTTQLNFSDCPLLSLQNPSQLCAINKKKRIFKHGSTERSNLFCGKRKWSHRDRNEAGEMRERSFSGGCLSKAHYLSKGGSKSYYDFKNAKKPTYKEKFTLPVKTSTVKCGLESAIQNINLSVTGDPPIPGSSKFNFVFRKPTLSDEIINSSNPKPSSELSMFVIPSTSEQSIPSKSAKKKEKYSKNLNVALMNQNQLRNPLQFDEFNTGMDCTNDNGHISSSSLSSSDSEGVVTNDSDREGDDELTDWPGNDEISSFTKTLTFKNTKSTSNNGSLFSKWNKLFSKKDNKCLTKVGQNSIKNKTDFIINAANDVQLMDDDTIMSDSGSVLNAFTCTVTRSNSDPTGPGLPTGFTTFGDVKNAGLLNNNINEPFFQSFQSFQENISSNVMQDMQKFAPRTNFTLQKTSSSDLNLSEKSPQSDHCFSDSVGFENNEVREIRAGCRRIRDTRPGFTILCVANEQLSKFLRDPYRNELKLPCFNNDPEEKEKLASLAKLYSLDLQIELGCPVLRKTVDTTQAVCVDHSRMRRYNYGSEFKRRCYDDDFNDSNSQLNQNISNPELVTTSVDFPAGIQYPTQSGLSPFISTDVPPTILSQQAAINPDQDAGNIIDVDIK